MPTLGPALPLDMVADAAARGLVGAAIVGGTKRKTGAAFGIEGSTVLDRMIIEIAAHYALRRDVELHRLDISRCVVGRSQVQCPVAIELACSVVIGLGKRWSDGRKREGERQENAGHRRSF